MKGFEEFALKFKEFNQLVQLSEASPQEKLAIQAFCEQIIATLKIHEKFSPEQQEYLYLAHVLMVSYYYQFTVGCETKKASPFQTSYWASFSVAEKNISFLEKHLNLKQKVLFADAFLTNVIHDIFQEEQISSLELLNNYIGAKFTKYQFDPFATHLSMKTSTLSPSQRHEELIKCTAVCTMLSKLVPNFAFVFQNNLGAFSSKYETISPSGAHKEEAKELEITYHSHKAHLDSGNLLAVVSLLKKTIEIYYKISSGKEGSGYFGRTGSKLKLEIAKLFKQLNIEDFIKKDNEELLKDFLRMPGFNYSEVSTLTAKKDEDLFFTPLVFK